MHKMNSADIDFDGNDGADVEELHPYEMPMSS